MGSGRIPFRTIAILAGLAIWTSTARAQTVEDFYKGKTLTMVVSAGVGEGFDTNARLVAKHLGSHLPGNPTIIAKNMPGAGHVLAANYLFNDAPRDGTTICGIAPSIIIHQLLDGRGARFDVSKFGWLGATDFSNQAAYVWYRTGIKTLAETRQREVLIGGTGAGSYSVLYPALMNNLLGTKFKVIAGYKSTKDIDIALERGEVEGRAGHAFSSLKAFNGDWIKDGKINILVQFGNTRDPDFANVPLATELASTEAARRVFELYDVQIAVGRPFLAPPDVPADRLAALRKAFDETVRDPAFRADAAKAKMEIHPLNAATVQGLIERVASTPSDVIAMAKRAKGETDHAH